MPPADPTSIPTGIDSLLLLWIGVVCLAVVVVSWLGLGLAKALGNRDLASVIGALAVGGAYVYIRDYGVPELVFALPALAVTGLIIVAVGIVATIRVSRAPL